MVLASTKFRLFWDSTVASIPANWSKDTDYANRYLQIDNEKFTGGVEGGNANHLHTDTTGHTPTGEVHTHNISGGNASRVTGKKFVPYNGEPIGFTPTQAPLHPHQATPSNDGQATYGNTQTTMDTTQALPPSINLVLIKPDDALQDIPSNASVLSMESSHTDFTLDTNDDKIIFGATGDGGATFGSATHTHTPSNHTHLVAGHDHGFGVTMFVIAKTLLRTGITNVWLDTHHKVSLNTSANGTTDAATATIANATSLPAYIRMGLYKNTSGSDQEIQDGMIVGFVGDLSETPQDWKVVKEAFDRQVYLSTTTSDFGDVGGSNSHTHEIEAHGHTHTHTHTVGNFKSGSGIADTVLGSTSANLASDKHVHVWTVTGNLTLTSIDASSTSDSTDTRVLYRTMILLKYKPVTVSIVGKTLILGNTSIV